MLRIFVIVHCEALSAVPLQNLVFGMEHDAVDGIMVRLNHGQELFVCLFIGISCYDFEELVKRRCCLVGLQVHTPVMVVQGIFLSCHFVN